MLKRIVFVIVFALWIPVIFIGTIAIVSIWWPIMIFRWIIVGRGESMMDIAMDPFDWLLSFPFEVTKIDV